MNIENNILRHRTASGFSSAVAMAFARPNGGGKNGSLILSSLTYFFSPRNGLSISPFASLCPLFSNPC